jgi:DnaK suppressor protein
MASSELTDEMLESMRAELLLKKASLSKSVANELEGMANSARHLSDLADAGGDANDEERSFKLLEIGNAELTQVSAALEQIAAGTYGVCVSCKEAVNIERLKALPFATQCINCKRLEESGAEGFD